MKGSPTSAAPSTSTREKTWELPGVAGVWVFVFIDMTFFGVLFLAYFSQRVGQHRVFVESQQTLDIKLGVINTAVLLVSSWLVAIAVKRNQAAARSVTSLLVLAIGCGVTFLVIKGVEYYAKISAGISVITNDFFTLYFAITAMHALHVAVGIAALTATTIALNGRLRQDGRRRRIVLESVATYWHMVDLLWVVILAVLYQAQWQ